MLDKVVVSQLLVLFFFCANRYEGLIQDGVVYTLQVFNYLQPERFVGDLAFEYGNQEVFGFFTWLYSSLMHFLPVNIAAFSACFFIHLFLAVSIVLFIFQWKNKLWVSKIAIIWGLIYIILFAYGEPRNELWSNVKSVESCVVSRTFSMAFGICGLAFIFNQKKIVSLIFFVIGFFIHPLTAGWGIPLWVLLRCPRFSVAMIAMALCFPLTALMNVGSLSTFSHEWIDVSFRDEKLISLAVQMTSYFCFFLLLYKKNLCGKCLKPFVKAFGYILFIALFWFVAAVLLRHVFLFQVQTFRIMWMCHLLIVFFQVRFLVRLYVNKIRRNKKLSVWEVALLATIPAFWIDSVLVDSLFVVLIVFFKLSKTRLKRWVCNILIILTFLLSVAVFALTLYLLDQRLFFIYKNYYYVMQNLVQIIVSLVIVCCLFWKKRSTFLLIIFPFLLYCCIRCQNVFGDICLANIVIIGAFVFLLLYFSWICKKKYRFLFLSVILVGECVYAFNYYDIRKESIKARETALNQFKEVMPFPYIENRGRILYSVPEYGMYAPRLAFLSGAYYDYQIDVGKLFFEQQSMEYDKRQKYIYYGSSVSYEEWKKLSRQSKHEKIWSVLFDLDSLTHRTSFLCDENEIDYMVSEFENMPLDKVDSLFLKFNNRYVYLYQCSSIKL